MLDDLVFKLTSSNSTIYDPQQLASSTTLEFTITNQGSDDLTDLGIYVAPSTTVGDLDYPADYPPETDYQDLIRWGEQTEIGVTVSGGLILTVPQNSGPDTVTYVTRQTGATLANKIPMADILAGGSLNLIAEIETPTGIIARRAYISLLVDSTT
jgi:hypothetical protein